MSLTNRDGWLILWFVLFVFIGLPALILTWLDLGAAIRQLEDPTLVTRVLRVIFGVPQAMLGFVSVLFGLAIVIWVFYNSFIERQPEYSGGFLTLGIGPALIIFGWYWARSAFTKPATLREEEPDEA